MIARDAIGNILAEGDTVIFALALGQIAIGQVVKVQSVLESVDPNAAQTVQVLLNLPMQVLQNGAVPGIVKAAKPQ